MTHLKPTGASLDGGCQGIWIVHATGALLTPVASADRERRRPPRFFDTLGYQRPRTNRKFLRSLALASGALDFYKVAKN